MRPLRWLKTLYTAPEFAHGSKPFGGRAALTLGLILPFSFFLTFGLQGALLSFKNR